jgi:hypothetical protein
LGRETGFPSVNATSVRGPIKSVAKSSPPNIADDLVDGGDGRRERFIGARGDIVQCATRGQTRDHLECQGGAGRDVGDARLDMIMGFHGCFTGEKPPAAVVVAHTFAVNGTSSSVLNVSWSTSAGVGATMGSTRTSALPHVVLAVALKGDGDV